MNIVYKVTNDKILSEELRSAMAQTKKRNLDRPWGEHQEPRLNTSENPIIEPEPATESTVPAEQQQQMEQDPGANISKERPIQIRKPACHPIKSMTSLLSKINISPTTIKLGDFATFWCLEHEAWL